jgi:hypothetical protein
MSLKNILLLTVEYSTLYFEDDYLMEVELAIHIHVDKWPMTLHETSQILAQKQTGNISEPARYSPLENIKKGDLFTLVVKTGF